MDRAQVVSKTISTFNSLRSKAAELFAEENIIGHSDLMIEEFFEAQFNPFVRDVHKAIMDVPANDYTIIAIEQWVKALARQAEQLESGNHKLEHAEAFYIHQKYIPVLANELNDAKLKLLEKLFSDESHQVSDEGSKLVEQKSNLKPAGVACFLAQLMNFGVVRTDIPTETLLSILAPVMGYSSEEIEGSLLFDKENHRFTAKANAQELEALAKVVRSMAARIENQLSVTLKQGE